MIVFLNPHAHDFLTTPVSFWLVKRRGLRKYAFLFEETKARYNRVDVLVDTTLSSLAPERIFNFFPYPIRRAILWLELTLWKHLNDLTFINVHYSAEDIENREHRAVLAFSYKDCAGLFRKRLSLLNAFALALVHLSHYMIRTGEKSENIRRIDNVVLVGDSDPSSNAYFRNFFGWYQRAVLVLPFVVSRRFTSLSQFSKRLDKAVATGSFHNLREEIPSRFYRDFVGFWGQDAYHPVRKLIFEHQGEVQRYIDCYVSPYRGTVRRRAGPSKLLAYFRVSQKQYFSINMVELYNRYKFAIVGEELSGFPALGAFEAMACGCVLLGQKGEYYEGLGLEEGVHYVAHDGTIEGIVETMRYLLARPRLAERIAAQGEQYVAEHMRGGRAYDRLIAFLNQMVSATQEYPRADTPGSRRR